ncbi:ArsO family NAD(P)H-dependent flavin-containing monooxygenase [Catelliglobosispora koreensis]|uniref:ArsO family NAD(P)H-dependent flavin-containing monooxygenase n=1 Tax=Catelliglobosispora koreensis TaxID=129052 RepID=UPI000363E5CC|nr:ArsO family NAD(P)H-dependent flavin-containing monooxygenase [Catelliglobosispora koreensis]
MISSGRYADVVVIGGGQAGLAAGFYLRRHGVDFAILDAQTSPGGAWQHVWESLRLFSPAQFSSLPGWQMPIPEHGGYPDTAHVIDYLTRYEQRYQLPIRRGVTVTSVHRTEGGFRLDTSDGGWTARIVVSATGTWWQPFIPALARNSRFTGAQLHTVHYGKPQDFAGMRVAVVGAGNSGAQIAADLAGHAAQVRWMTHMTPRFLPDDVDGRVLFQLANQRYRALKAGLPAPAGISELGDVVAVPPVRDARDAGRLHVMPMFTRLAPDGTQWSDGSSWPADAIIWATGFRPALHHLAPLHLQRVDGHPVTDGTAYRHDPRLHLLGYGDWTGPAAATLIGVGPIARDMAAQVKDLLASQGVSPVTSGLQPIPGYRLTVGS